MFMDDKNLPVSLDRLMIMIWENTKQTARVIQENVLLPYQIREYLNTIEKKCPIQNVSQKFIQ